MLKEERFLIRRAIERLREGLFDPVAVERLTIEASGVQTLFSQGLEALDKGDSLPLFLSGSYGQGKSHTLLHLKNQALHKGYATSLVQLDIRETPFHNLSALYQSLMDHLLLPVPLSFLKAWKKQGHQELLEGVEIPHRFRMILTALLARTKELTPKEKKLKKYRDYQPKECGRFLNYALLGRPIPTLQLKKALRSRGIEEDQKASLTLSGNAPYMQMIQSLGILLKKMGYKGLVLLFDEGEAITQGRLKGRAKSYLLLDQLFCARGSVYPLFAFTEDFFDRVHNESYEDPSLFPKNYGEAWKNLPLLRLEEISKESWPLLLDRLIQLYQTAYPVTLPSSIKETLNTALQTLEGKDTRFKLKSLVYKLDIASQ